MKQFIQSLKIINKRSVKILILTFIFSASVLAQSDDRFPFQTAKEAQQFATITAALRCVVCQNQSLADSDAPLALDLKNKIRRMILAHQTNADIQNYLAKRYGDFILLQPPFNFKTWALWLLPFVGVLSILLFVCAFPKTDPR